MVFGSPPSVVAFGGSYISGKVEMQLCLRSVFNGSQAWGLNSWFRVQGRDLPIVWKRETGKNVQVRKYFFLL